MPECKRYITCIAQVTLRAVEQKYQSSSIGKHLLNKQRNVPKDLDRYFSVFKAPIKRKLSLGSYKIYPFKHGVSKFEIAGVKIADFVSAQSWAFKNGIRIARPKCQVTITADVTLVPRIAIHHGGIGER